MVRKVNVIALLIGLLAACVKVPEPVEGPTPKLSSIDSLMWQQPDSALQALMAYEGDASEYNHHYAQLLTSELLYKNYYEQTNRPELQQAVAYFDSLMQVSEPQRSLSLSKGRSASAKTTAFLTARAHYINGVGYYERDSAVEACREYLKALEVMEGHFEEKEMVEEKANFMAITCTHLAGLFSDHYLPDQAIYFGKKSLDYYKKYEAPPRHVAWILNETGSQYEVKDMLDSACFYYQSGINVLPDTNNLTYRDLATRQALLDYKMENPVESSLNRLSNLLVLSESEKESSSRCLTIGGIFYQEKQYDSAQIYLNPVFHGSTSLDAKKQAAEWLVEICKVQGNTSEIMEYSDFLVPFATENENQGALKSQLTTMCQNYMLEKQKQLHQKRSNKLVIAIPVAVIVAFVVVFAIKRRSKKQMERERHAHKMQQAALTGKLRKSNEALRELKGQIQQQENDAVSKPEQADTFADEPICQLIMERVNEGQFKSQMDCTVYKDYALGKEQLMALREAADRHFNRFTSRLAQTYPSLTKGDLDYCCLYLLGLTDSDISALMQKAYSTVSDRSRKLKAVFESEESLSAALQGFANSVATD
jgi:tetratricopeptide (TPR) repeat protein